MPRESSDGQSATAFPLKKEFLMRHDATSQSIWLHDTHKCDAIEETPDWLSEGEALLHSYQH